MSVKDLLSPRQRESFSLTENRKCPKLPVVYQLVLPELVWQIQCHCYRDYSGVYSGSGKLCVRGVHFPTQKKTNQSRLSFLGGGPRAKTEGEKRCSNNVQFQIYDVYFEHYSM